MDIQNYERKHLAKIRGIKQSLLSERNKELILAVHDALVLENLSKPRLMKYLEILRTFAIKLGKDLDQAKMEDIKRVVSEIQQRNYSAWTKQTYKIIIRRFYKWLYQTKGFPEIVDWISIRMSRSEKKLPSEGDLLTEQEIHQLIEVATHPRDKALVAILWESGARIGEIGNLALKHIAFDKHGIMVTLHGKTGSRRVRLIWSVPYVSTWLNNHPFKTNPSAPVWINIGNTRHHEAMNYANIRAHILDLAQLAGITKRVNPHTFRHSRATFMANHLTEFQMNQYFGWIQGSDMPSTYVHMSGREVDQAILAMNGIKAELHKEENKLLPQRCPRCDTINSHDSKYCIKCGGILDLRLAMELDERQEQETKLRESSDKVMNLLLQDTHVQEMLLEKLRELRGNGLSF